MRSKPGKPTPTLSSPPARRLGSGYREDPLPAPDRKRWWEFLGLLKSLQARWSGERLYIIAASFSPHKLAEVWEFTAGHDVEFVSSPTHSSSLNWIESQFAALRYFALNSADHRSHGEQHAAIGAYIRRHSQHARPKRPRRRLQIRRPDYILMVS